MHDSTASMPSCVSYKYRPSGEHKWRLIVGKPRMLAAPAVLVNSIDLHEERWVTLARGGRSGFGALPRRTAFTKLGKERVQDAGAIQDKKYGKCIAFVTGTIPACGDEADQTVARFSAYIVQRVKQLIVDEFSGLDLIWVFERHEMGQLHFHASAGSTDRTKVQAFINAWRIIWCRALEAVTERSGFNLACYSADCSEAANRGHVVVDSQWVTKSVAQYLAKYLSKSAGTVGGADCYCPSRWWGISKSLLAQIEEATIRVLSPVQPYMVARAMYSSLAKEIKKHAETFFNWKNKYAPLNRTCVAWLAGPTKQARAYREVFTVAQIGSLAEMLGDGLARAALGATIQRYFAVSRGVA